MVVKHFKNYSKTLRRMNNALKLAIPLISDKLSLDDISEEAGFVDAYFEDINRPSLTNHVFLLYDGKLDTVEKLERDVKLREIDTLYLRKTIFISGNPYLLYVFVILNEGIKSIRKGFVPYKQEDMNRIMMFWNLEDPFVNDLFTSRKVTFEQERGVVPEEDYIPSWEEEFDDSFF